MWSTHPWHQKNPLESLLKMQITGHHLRFSHSKILWWASLVAQWLRICLPMQGTRVRALVWEDPTCCGATKPVSYSYWACASGGCAPPQERPRHWQARAPRWRVAPALRKWRKPSHRNEDPTQPKINIIINKLMKKNFVDGAWEFCIFENLPEWFWCSLKFKDFKICWSSCSF